jgi:predicted RNase H-like nuclease (RuvC/YqgF family)
MAESTLNTNDLDEKLNKALIYGLYQENKELKDKIEQLNIYTENLKEEIEYLKKTIEIDRSNERLFFKKGL